MPSRTPRQLSLLPAYPPQSHGLHRPFARFRTGPGSLALCRGRPCVHVPLSERPRLPLYPRGPWLRSELCCLGPSSLTTTPSASPTGTLRLHGLAAYTQRLRCAGTPRRPAGPSLLSLPCFRYMPPTLPRWSAKPSRCAHLAIPGFLELLPSRRPQAPPLPATPGGVTHFGAASFALCYGLHVCLALLTGYDEMKSRALHRAF